LTENLRQLLNGETFNFSFDEIQAVLGELISSDIQNFTNSEVSNIDEFLSSLLSNKAIQSSLFNDTQELLRQIRNNS